VVRDVVPFGEPARTWFAISLQTFGGPAGQIAVMQRTLVDEKRWIGQQRFLHALNYCMLLPGRRRNNWPSTPAGCSTAPPAASSPAPCSCSPAWLPCSACPRSTSASVTPPPSPRSSPASGPAVLAIVAQAVSRVARRALAHPALVAVPVAAFGALAVFAVPFPLVIAAAAAIGWALRRFPLQTTTSGNSHSTGAGPATLIPDDALHTEPPPSAAPSRF
jgi:chromate transporter